MADRNLDKTFYGMVVYTMITVMGILHIQVADSTSQPHCSKRLQQTGTGTEFAATRVLREV